MIELTFEPVIETMDLHMQLLYLDHQQPLASVTLPAHAFLNCTVSISLINLYFFTRFHANNKLK